jgi:hypothetical protein
MLNVSCRSVSIFTNPNYHLQLNLLLFSMRHPLVTILLVFATSSLAFPAMESAAREGAGCPFAANSVNSKRQSNVVRSVGFDPVKQKIDVSGKYAFQAPRAGDKRVSHRDGKPRQH